MGETPSSLERITSIPDEFNDDSKVHSRTMEKNSMEDTMKTKTVIQPKGDHSLASMEDTFKSSTANTFENSKKSILLTNRSKKNSNKVRVTMMLPEQPRAEMTSVNLLEPSDESMTRNELLMVSH